MSTEDDLLALKEATREAHEALQDLRAVVKEAKAIKGTLRDEAIEALANGVRDIVAAGLGSYAKMITGAIDDAVDRVNKRFDTLADVLMGEDKRTRRRGEPSLLELAEAHRDANQQAEEVPDGHA